MRTAPIIATVAFAAATFAGCTSGTAPAADPAPIAPFCDAIEQAASDASDARMRSVTHFRDAAEALMLVLRVEGVGQQLQGEPRDRLREMGGMPGARERVLTLSARGAAWCEASNGFAPRVAAPAMVALDAGLVPMDSDAGRALILAARAVSDARYDDCDTHVRDFTDMHDERNADAVAAWDEEQGTREAALVEACRAAAGPTNP